MKKPRTARKKQDEEGAIRATTERRTGAGPRPISRTLDTLIARSGQKRGFGQASLLLEWPAIVGSELAGRTAPDKLVRGRGTQAARLHIRVAAGWALEVQHMAPAILERINGFFGYRAVEDIRLMQGFRHRDRSRHGPVRPQYVRKDVSETLDQIVASVEDDEMAAALRELANAVRAPRP